MHTQSFVFFEGIQALTERKIWEQGINNWQEFLEQEVKGIGNARKSLHRIHLDKLNTALKEVNEEKIASLIPRKHMWRMYEALKHEAIYLDIETTYRNDITVIGIYNGEEQLFLVKGFNLNLENFLAAIKDSKVILTFNGSSFDIPVIENYFKTKINKPHIDLMHVCRKIGLVGGLKNIEKEIGINRPTEVEGVAGDDAVLLWMLFKETGNKRYLRQLLAYNEQDCINLETLAEYSIPKLWQKVRKDYILATE